MKTYAWWPLLLLAFGALSLLLLFLLSQGTNGKPISQISAPHQNARNTSPGLPVRLRIPSINVNAAVQRVGVTPTGDMGVPSNAIDVAWFYPGPRPAEKGSAVIAGHFSGENGEAGVFFNLYKLKKGDTLYIEDDKGASISFVVRESDIYSPGYAEEVFSANDGVHLNLVTCDGVWNGTTKSYTKRLVVFADIAP